MIQERGYRKDDTAYRIQDTGCWIKDNMIQERGYRIQDAG